MKKGAAPFFFKGYTPIFLGFSLLVLVKVILSFFFEYPWIFADETVYAETARNIIHGSFYSNLQYSQTYPPGYPLFLSAAYLVSGGPFVSYHGMLIINSILTSSIIFPAYFMLKKYCPQNFSIVGSFFIGILPAVFLYNFVIMSENLFIPLFMFSLWFLIEFFETRSRIWGILAGFSIFLLFFARTPGIAMIVGFFLALAFSSLIELKSENIRTLLLENCYPVAAFGIPSILWMIYRLNLGMTSVSGYNNDMYLSSVLTALSSIPFFMQFLLLTFHEFEFLILSSYFIFFILAFYCVYEIFCCNAFCGIDRPGVPKNIRNPALKSGIVYISVASLITILITVAHMFSAVVFQENASYLIFGRYIDPLVPIIILLGLMGFYHILQEKIPERKKISTILLSINVLFLVLFLLDFPAHNYKFPNMFGIYYVQGISGLIPFFVFIILFVLVVSGVFIFTLYFKKFWYIVVILLIIFSGAGMRYSVSSQYLRSSDVEQNTHPIVDYLINDSDESIRILMSPEEYRSEYGIITWYSTQFFIDSYLIQSREMPGAGDQTQEIDYILSQKILTKNVLAVSRNGFKLYNLSERERREINVPYTIHFGEDTGGRIENFYPPDWTKNSSKILIEYPKNFGDMNLSVTIDGIRPNDNPAHIIFKMNDRILSNGTFTGGNKLIFIDVPKQYLNDYNQFFEIDTNTWRPADYGSKDMRDLGIPLTELTVNRSSDYAEQQEILRR